MTPRAPLANEAMRARSWFGDDDLLPLKEHTEHCEASNVFWDSAGDIATSPAPPASGERPASGSNRPSGGAASMTRNGWLPIWSLIPSSCSSEWKPTTGLTAPPRCAEGAVGGALRTHQDARSEAPLARNSSCEPKKA